MSRIPASMRLLLPILLLLGLGACEPASMLMTGASVIGVIQSEQTLGDKALSWALNKECSLFQVARGEEYCQSRAPQPVEKYCYRNLGGITCYTQPDPDASPEVAVYSETPPPATPEPAAPAPSASPGYFAAERR